MISFYVAGVPAPQGSKRAFRNAATGRIHLVESSKKVAPWRERVGSEAQRAMNGSGPLSGPLSAVISFDFVRPPSHLTSKREPRSSAPLYPSPDLDKLVRATLDGMTGIVFANDSQIFELEVSKRYADRGGALINVMQTDTIG